MLLTPSCDVSGFGCGFGCGLATSASVTSAGLFPIILKVGLFAALPVRTIPITTFIFFNCSLVVVSGTVVVNFHTYESSQSEPVFD